MTRDQQSVLAANAAFYEAFSNRDIQGMEKVWSNQEDIAVIHPGWPPLLGWRSVMSSWKRIMQGGASPAISCVDSRANILGETAIVICTEILSETELVATNIFYRENTSWKLVHHQAGPLPPAGHPTDEEQVH